ncbi:hypothetical protein Q0V21_14225 [Paenibacillus sp. 11B]|nr:hypothetical protein [Paenibacillus sp. 11B]
MIITPKNKTNTRDRHTHYYPLQNDSETMMQLTDKKTNAGNSARSCYTSG